MFTPQPPHPPLPPSTLMPPKVQYISASGFLFPSHPFTFLSSPVSCCVCIRVCVCVNMLLMHVTVRELKKTAWRGKVQRLSQRQTGHTNKISVPIVGSVVSPCCHCHLSGCACHILFCHSPDFSPPRFILERESYQDLVQCLGRPQIRITNVLGLP